MHPKDFERHIDTLARLPLPGLQAHTSVLLPYRNDLMRRYPHLEYRPAAVLALIFPQNGHLQSVLIQRYVYDGVHSGQMAFPGGKAEAEDDSLARTALREAREETGIPEADVHIIRPLTPVKIPVSRYKVTPYLGWLPYAPALRPQPGEVAAIHTVDWDYLMQAPWQQELRTYEGRSYPIHFIPLNGQKIWGATAMVIAEIRDLWKRLHGNS